MHDRNFREEVKPPLDAVSGVEQVCNQRCVHGEIRNKSPLVDELFI